MIRATNLSVRRGGRAILADISLSLERGAFTALIGANGAGKSTLLACLAGLLKPDEGSVEIGGRALERWAGGELARVRAYLPQNPRCEWPISVERLVALGLTPALPAVGGLTPAMSERIAQTLADCDLTERKDQPATTLSGGELGRAMLARTLVGDPEVLIVDEPTSGLDPRHALDAAARLKRLAGEGRLVIAAMHDLTLAARHADRLVALSGGRIVASGPTDEVLTPALVEQVFGVTARIIRTTDGPLIDLLQTA